MLNTGVMVIHPERDFVPSLRNALDANNWQSAREGWVRCTEAALLQSDTDVMMARLCGGPGVFTSFCTQGFVDAVFLAKGPRLGQAVWTSEATFGGCGEYGGSMSRPARPWSDHCTLDEGYNLQVTRPHLGWHMPFLQELARTGGSIRVVHWPGKPKPWMLGRVQRTEWERMWWSMHATLCGVSGTSQGVHHGCWLRC